MKQYLYTLLLASAFLFFSCEMKKDIFGQGNKGETEVTTEGQGILDLELKPQKEAEIPESKGGITGSEVVVLDVNEFAIDILDANSIVVKHYDSYADLKSEGGLLLPGGNYMIRATLGDDVNAGFDKPFYSGTNVCEITPQEVAKVITDCVLSNKKVTFHCSDEFLKKFEDDYSIVIDNNAGALTTKREETRVTYLKNTGILQFTVYATLKNGSRTLVYNYDMSKNEQVQQYNNILVDLDLVEDTPPTDPDEPDEPVDPGDPELPDDSVTVKAPVIKVDVSLVEKEFIIEIPSDFVDAGDSGDNTGGNEKPGGGDTDVTNAKPTITGTMDGKSFDVGTEQTFTSSTKSVIINLYLPTGLNALNVGVNIGSSIKLPLDLLDSSSIDQINELLASSGKKLTVPSKGDKGNLKFDISPFLSMLDIENSFVVTVKDDNGKSANATITLKKK